MRTDQRMIGLHVPSAPHESPAQQSPALGMHTPPSVGGGWSAMACVHCGVWLCVLMSCNGSQNPVYEGSFALGSRLTAAIHSCGCWQTGWNFCPCAEPGSSKLSAG